MQMYKYKKRKETSFQSKFIGKLSHAKFIGHVL